MGWIQWVTLVIAVIGAGLGIVNTATNVRRGLVKLGARAVIENDGEGLERLRIEVVNTGHVPVTVNDVFLAGSGGEQGRYRLFKDESKGLWQDKYLACGTKLVIRSRWEAVAFRMPFMANIYGVAIDIADGSYITIACDALSERADQVRSHGLEVAAMAANLPNDAG